MGGIIHHARSLVAVVCPIVNSYKRMGVGAPTSGATWAPAYAAYGGNNRTQMIRIPEPDRIELRLGDGAANPYLMFATYLACGLDGIDNDIDPGEPNTDNLHACLRSRLRPRASGRCRPRCCTPRSSSLPAMSSVRDWATPPKAPTATTS